MGRGEQVKREWRRGGWRVQVRGKRRETQEGRRLEEVMEKEKV